MGIVVFVVLALIVAAIVAYPLLPGRAAAQTAPAVTDGDIDRAVRQLRQARNRTGLFCPACGQAYQTGDRFCVGCGSELPQVRVPVAVQVPVCPSCGAIARAGDRFCAKCGHDLAQKEGVG